MSKKTEKALEEEQADTELIQAAPSARVRIQARYDMRWALRIARKSFSRKQIEGYVALILDRLDDEDAQRAAKDAE